MATGSNSEREVRVSEALLAKLSTRVAAPSQTWPTVRCWTNHSLQALLREIRSELAEDGLKSDSTHKSIAEWLSKIGIEHTIEAEGQSFHLLEMGAKLGSPPDALEFMMAAQPAGVVAYFSAVAFHSLTTQPAVHHHIATVVLSSPRSSPSRSDDEADRKQTSPKSPSDSKMPRLGKLMFRHQSIPYYSTRRSARLVPGIQIRGHGPRSQIRMTDTEQTLLDTLSKPFHCGGPEVVFEAWNEATESGRIDEDKLADYLQRMDYPATSRRLAVMCSILGYSPGRELRKILEQAKGEIDRARPFVRISLLPGLAYKNLDDNWLVLTP